MRALNNLPPLEVYTSHIPLRNDTPKNKHQQIMTQEIIRSSQSPDSLVIMQVTWWWPYMLGRMAPLLRALCALLARQQCSARRILRMRRRGT